MDAAETIIEIARFLYARGGSARFNEIVHQIKLADMQPDETGPWLMRCLTRAMNMGDVEAELDGTYRLSPRVMAQFAAAEPKPLDKALAAAEALAETLRPLASRLEIAGSVRRHKPEVGDIEIVALTQDQRCYRALAGRAMVVCRSGPRHTQAVIETPEAGPVKVDLFQVPDPAEWGMLLFIRTGSADFVRRALGYWKKITGGGYCENNRLYRSSGEVTPTPEEADVYAALQCPFVEPERRN